MIKMLVMTESELEIAEIINANLELKPILGRKQYPEWLSPEAVVRRINELLPDLLLCEQVKFGAEEPQWRRGPREDDAYLRGYYEKLNLVAVMCEDAQFRAMAARLFEFVNTDVVAEVTHHERWMLQTQIIAKKVHVYIAYEGKTGGRNCRGRYEPEMKAEELEPEVSRRLCFTASNRPTSVSDFWQRSVFVDLKEHEISLTVENGHQVDNYAMPLESPHISQRVETAQKEQEYKLKMYRMNDNLVFQVPTIPRPIILPLSIKPDNLIQE